MTSRLQVACIHDLCAWSTAECVSEELVTKRMECQQNAAFIHLIYSTLCLCKFFVSFFFFSKVCFCHTLKYDLWVLQGSEAVMCCCVIQPANVCYSPDPLRQDTDNLPADLFFSGGNGKWLTSRNELPLGWATPAFSVFTVVIVKHNLHHPGSFS